jgi:hypothetical protein
MKIRKKSVIEPVDSGSLVDCALDMPIDVSTRFAFVIKDTARNCR